MGTLSRTPLKTDPTPGRRRERRSKPQPPMKASRTTRGLPLRLPTLLAASLLSALAPALRAQQAPADSAADAAAPASAKADDSGDVLQLGSVVVTATTTPGQTKMDSSVAVSSFTQQDLSVSVPRSTGELFRNIPSIRVESSSGDGNLNLTARGLPISAGGAKYVQLQEDGLPILQFGDISFATADQWLRSDYGVGNIESVIGGAASTQATNAPGGHGSQPSQRPPRLDTHPRHDPRRATGRPEERPAQILIRRFAHTLAEAEA